jgi:hypothetical protein
MYLFCLMSGFPTWAPNGVGITCAFFLRVSSLFPLCATLMSLSLCSWVTLNSHRCLRKRTSVVRRSYFVCPMFLFCFECRYFHDVPSRYIVAKRVHFIWSSAFTIAFCLVCGIPAALLLSLVTTKLLYMFI